MCNGLNRFGSGCGWNKLGSSKIEKGGGGGSGLGRCRMEGGELDWARLAKVADVKA